MLEQRELIHNGCWDTLLLFDACRYDYLREELVEENMLEEKTTRVVKGSSQYSVEKDFVEIGDKRGVLKKVRSPSFETSSWLWKNFGNGTSFKDIIYISANPYVNTKGIETERFDARGKFFKVVPAREHWDEETQTVLPEDVSRLVRKYRMEYPSKRIIAHYMQPHYPFLSIGPINGLRSPDEDNDVANPSLFGKIMKKITVFTQRHLGTKGWYLQFGLAKLLLGRDSHVVEKIADEYSVDTLRQAYRRNVDTVLESASSLIDRLPSNERTVITADHGYLLGEDGEFAHMTWHNPDILRNVPWMVIE